MTLLMRDSITAADIPLEGLTVVAGYGNGVYAWSSADWARFPPPIVPLSVVVSADGVGDVLDVEKGDATPADCPGWADRFNRPGRRLPTIYSSRSSISWIRQAMGSRPFDWWVATLDGTQDIAGAVAVQYCGAAGSGDPCETTGHYDESIILDPSWVGPEDPEVLDPKDPIVRQLLQHTNTAAALLAIGVDTDPNTFQQLPATPHCITPLLTRLLAHHSPPPHP